MFQTGKVMWYVHVGYMCISFELFCGGPYVQLWLCRSAVSMCKQYTVP